MESGVNKYKYLWIICASLLVSFVTSCSSSNGISPEASTEPSSSFPFPTSIGIDVDKISASESSEPVDIPSPIAKDERRHGRKGPPREVADGGEFSTEISIGATMADDVIEAVDAILEIFDGVDVPVGEGTTTLESTVTNDDESRTLKMDFGRYDYDGDGGDESCSGQTGSLPICFRIWLDGERFMAGFFDEYPTDDSPGKGEFRLVDLLGAAQSAQEDFPDDEADDEFADEFDDAFSDDFGGIDPLSVGAIYDHDDPENKSTELFSIRQEEGGSDQLHHVTLTETGPASSAKRTLSVTRREFAEISYLGEWFEDEDYWTGEIFSGDDGVKSGAVPCAQISTGNSVDEALCEALGISVEGLEFIDLPTAADVSLPDDFPETPTF